MSASQTPQMSLEEPKKKKQRTNEVYVQAPTGAGRNVNTRVVMAVSALKAHKGNPVRIQDLAYETGWDELEYNAECQEMLKQHERVEFNNVLKLFSYKADHQISTPAQLLEAIKKNRDTTGGVSISSLKESWTGADEALRTLIERGDILMGKKQVFWNEVPPDRGGRLVDSEFREAWHALKVPTDVERALAESGIKSSTTEQSERRVETSAPGKKGKKKASRSVKITNKHMASLGVDLTKDRIAASDGKAAKKK